MEKFSPEMLILALTLGCTTAAPENVAIDVVPGSVFPVQLVAVLKSVVPPALFQAIAVCAAMGPTACERPISARARAQSERDTSWGRADSWNNFTEDMVG